MEELEKGTRVELAIPFVYYIGEKHYLNNKVLKTVDDCIEAVNEELYTGLMDPYVKLLTVEKPG